MLCPNCKKEIPEGTQFCPGCGTAANASVKAEKKKKPITKKWWFWIIIVVVVIAVIGSVGGSDDDSGVQADSDNVLTSQNAEQSTKNEETTTAAAENVFKAGDTLSAGDIAITYVSAEVWTGYDRYFGPDEGNKIVRLKFEFVNNSSADYYVSPYEFSCYADNQSASEYFYGDDLLDTVNLSAGRSISGYVYFQVPKDAKTIEVEYETNFWTDSKAVFAVEL